MPQLLPRLALIALALALPPLGISTGCSKPAPPATLILGTWEFRPAIPRGTDPEAGEEAFLAARKANGWSTERTTFRADGTGQTDDVRPGFTDTLPFYWELVAATRTGITIRTRYKHSSHEESIDYEINTPNVLTIASGKATGLRFRRVP